MLKLESFVTEKTYIILDWNGTLFDDVDLCVGVIQSVLKKYALPSITKSEYQKRFKFPVIEYYESLGFDFEKVSWEEVAMEFINRYQVGMFEAPLYDGTVELLKKLKSQNKILAVLSASKEEDLKQLLSHHKIDNYFDHVCGLNHYYATSKLDLGRNLLQQMKADPDKTVLIGDTDHDAEVAGELGIEVLLFPDGHQNVERLSKYQATLLPGRTESFYPD